MVTLSNGKKIEIDLSKVTRREYRDFANPQGTLLKEDLFVSKVTGLALDEIEQMLDSDFRLIATEIYKARHAPPPN